MAASPAGSEEALGEIETRDGSDTPKNEVEGGSPRSITAGRTETEDVDDGCSSVSSVTSNIRGTHSDVEGDFDPD